MDMSIVVIKVKFGDTLRRFNAHTNYNKSDLNYNIITLRERISKLFGFTPDVDYTLTYIDEDKDIVTLHDDNDLSDIAAQSLNPVRLNVSLKNPDKLGGFYVTPSGISTPQLPFHILNSGVSDILKYVPDRLHSTLSNILNDMAADAASSTLVLAEFINTVQKVYMEKQKDVTIGGSDPDYLKNCLQEIKRKSTKEQCDVGIGGSNADYLTNSFKEIKTTHKTNESVVKSCSDESRVPPIKVTYDHNNGLCNVSHIGVICDGCNAYPITGSRFKSKVKVNYDLCNICFKKMGQDADYIRMDLPRTPCSPSLNNSHDHDDDTMKNLGTSKASIDLNSPPVCDEEKEPKVVTPDKGQGRNVLINDTLTISNGRVKDKQQTRFNNMHWPFLDELKDELRGMGVSSVSS